MGTAITAEFFQGLHTTADMKPHL